MSAAGRKTAESRTRRLAPIVLAAALAASPAAAQTSGAFLRINPSARSYSLGMADTVSSLGAQAFGANPANLGLLQRRFEVFTSYASLLDGTEYEHVAAALQTASVPFFDSFGVAVTRLQSNGFPTADSAGNQTGGTFNSGDMAVALGGSGRLGDNLRLGAAVKTVQSEIAGYKSGTSIAGDAGATYTFPWEKPLSLGLSVTNFGQGIKFISQTDPLPTSVNLGAALSLGKVMAVAEINQMLEDKTTQIGAGAELALGPVAFRGGIMVQDNPAANLALQDQNTAGKILAGLTGGVGLQIAGCALDYAISQQAVDFGPTQRVSLTLRFGQTSLRSAQRLQPLEAKQVARRESSDWLMTAMGDY